MAGPLSATAAKCVKWIVSLRNRHVLMLDVLALTALPAVALTLRVDGLSWWPQWSRAMALYVLVALAVKLPLYRRLGLYRRYWRYAGVGDLTPVVVAVGSSTLILTALYVVANRFLRPYGLAIPRSVPLIEGLLTGAAVGGDRLGLRGLYHWLRERGRSAGGRQLLVVGAGEAGMRVVEEVWANPQLHMEPVAYIDDEPSKVGTWIHGVKVVGTCAQIPEVVRQYKIRQIIVAMPSAPLRRRQEVVAICEETGVDTYSVPGMMELLAGYKTLSELPHVDIGRLLRREPVVLDQAGLAAHLTGATVLVTGAGGSIGSELCRQIARFAPEKLILLGHGENSIFEIGLDLRLSFPDLVTESVIADVRDRERIYAVVETSQPDIVFHAAAHKHVPLMEACVDEAITNNVLGTWNVLEAAERYGVERLILISSDKAVNQTSVMGATKRLAELLTVAAARRSGHAYQAVRFGNVLGSRGSVVPVFQRQIAAGGPVTVTHPDMCRYFMTIPEAVQLVLKASELGRGGEIFVLDMGQPVRILDLASDLIRLSGLVPGRDIEIVYTGARPGEKLFEELVLEQESLRRTSIPKILVTTAETIDPGVLEPLVGELIGLAQEARSDGANARMCVLLSEVCHHIDDCRLPPQAVPGGQAGFAAEGVKADDGQAGAGRERQERGMRLRGMGSTMPG